MTLDQAIKTVTIAAARAAKGNKSEMARILDVQRPRIYTLLRKYHISLADAVRGFYDEIVESPQPICSHQESPQETNQQ